MGCADGSVQYFAVVGKGNGSYKTGAAPIGSGQFGKEQGVVLGAVGVRAGKARGMNAGRTGECVDFKTRVVGEDQFAAAKG